MPEQTDWSARWAALSELDGEAWDRESEQLDELWRREYREAFVGYALSRRGWTRENAEVWAAELANMALLYHAGDPARAAQADVIVCEQETRSAW
jgi:hypothetical protein